MEEEGRRRYLRVVKSLLLYIICLKRMRSIGKCLLRI